MSLDISTPQGRIHAEQQKEAARIVFKDGPNRFFHTRTDDKALIDGVIINQECYVCGVAEIKSRDLTHDRLFGDFRGEWLISLSKIEDLCSASILFGVPGYGMLYLVPDQIVLMIRIFDECGIVCAEIRHEVTKTKATCNGGEAMRDNAFVQMNKAKPFRK